MKLRPAFAFVVLLSAPFGCTSTSGGRNATPVDEPGGGARTDGPSAGVGGATGGGTGNGGSTVVVDALSGAGGGTTSPDGATVSDMRAPSDAPASGDGAPVVGGESKPCNYAFCESFEAYGDGDAPGMGVWARTSPSLVVGSLRAARGKRALHVPDLMVGTSFIRTTKPFPQLGMKMWGRLYVWIEKEPIEKPGNPDYYHWTAAEGSARPEGGGLVLRTVGAVRVALNNDRVLFNIETNGQGESGSMAPHSPARLVASKRWHCFEWFQDRQGNQFRFWWDGKELPELAYPPPGMVLDPKFNFPELKSFSIGWAEYRTTRSPWDVWLDELVLHTDRVGCQG